MQKIDLKRTPIPRLFFTYFIPALFTMLALSTYSTIDGIFVGQKMGSDALAAIVIVWPVFPIIIAFELLLSFGGSTLAAFYIGRDKARLARVVFSSIFYFAFLSALCCSVIGYIYAEKIVQLLGASITLEHYATQYLEVISLGLIFIILHPLVDTFVVNDRRPVLATVSMLVGAVSNIILNYYFIFVFEWGVAGSAWATILAHCIGFFMILQHFLRKKGDLYFAKAFSFKYILTAIKTGVPQSSAELSAAIAMFLFNVFLMKISGERGVAIYGIVLYSGIAYYSVLLSISQGMQPIVSYSFGARLFDRIKQVYRFCFVMVFLVSVAIYMVFYFFGHWLVVWFLNTEQLKDPSFLEEVIVAMRIYYIGFIFLGINILSAIFFQSLRRIKSSLIITLCYSVVFLGILIPIMSDKYGQIGIWASNPIAQFLAFLVVIPILYYQNKKIFRVKK